MIFLKIRSNSLYLWFGNNIFQENSANFAPCFDVESDGVLDYQNNKFLDNFVSPSINYKIGAGAVIMLNGKNLKVHSKMNYYFRNFGYLYGYFEINLIYLL